jgi:hypothetical protein
VALTPGGAGKFRHYGTNPKVQSQKRRGETPSCVIDCANIKVNIVQDDARILSRITDLRGNQIVTPTTAKLLAWEFKGETYINGDDDVAEGGMICEMAGWPEWLLTYNIYGKHRRQRHLLIFFNARYSRHFTGIPGDTPSIFSILNNWSNVNIKKEATNNNICFTPTL